KQQGDRPDKSIVQIIFPLISASSLSPYPLPETTMLRKLLLLSFLVLICNCLLYAQTKRPINVDDQFALKDISDERLSPDGKWIAYVVENTSLEKDDSFSNIYMIPFAGGTERQLTFTGNDRHPRW